jgi:hypothetical protein
MALSSRAYVDCADVARATPDATNAARRGLWRPPVGAQVRRLTHNTFRGSEASPCQKGGTGLNSPNLSERLESNQSACGTTSKRSCIAHFVPKLHRQDTAIVSTPIGARM